MNEVSLVLVDHAYGKKAITLLVSVGTSAQIIELEAEITLSGGFEPAFLIGDNSTTLPSDALKNHLAALAAARGLDSLADFGDALLEGILESTPVAELGSVTLRATPWLTLNPDFDGTMTRRESSDFVTVERQRSGSVTFGGGTTQSVLRKGNSSFAGFLRDRYTDQDDVSERMLFGKLEATWKYTDKLENAGLTHDLVCGTLIEAFSRVRSRSVQETLFGIGSWTFDAVVEISELDISFASFPLEELNAAEPEYGTSAKVWSQSNKTLGVTSARMRRRELQ